MGSDHILFLDLSIGTEFSVCGKFFELYICDVHFPVCPLSFYKTLTIKILKERGLQNQTIWFKFWLGLYYCVLEQVSCVNWR